MTGDAQTGAEAAPWAAFEGYLGSRLAPHDDVLEAVLAASVEAGLPPIHLSPNQGAFLGMLVQVSGARRVLELGTLGGYSTIWMARALPDGGHLVTVEADPHHAEVARANLLRAGLTDEVDARLGLAGDVVDALVSSDAPPFDLVFVDVDEAVNAEVFLPVTRLTAPGGVIVVGAADLVRGTRRLVAAIAQVPHATATAVQAVGSKGLGGLVLVRLGDAARDDASV